MWKFDPEAEEIKLFGIIMCINYPLYWLIWGQNSDKIDISLRLIATFLCLGLLLKNFWPKKRRNFFLIYWHITLTFCLPFFFTFMLLKNQVSAVWLMNCMSALFFNLLVTPIIGFFITMILGVSLGSLAFFLFIGNFEINLGVVDLYSIFWTFFGALVIGATFSQRKIQLHQEKLHGMKSLAGAIAHEMRTPLLTLDAMAHKLKKLLPNVINGFKQSSLFSESDKTVELLNALPISIKKTTRGAFNIINILLMNLREEKSNETIKICSMSDCIDEALEEYHLSNEEKKLIIWKKELDFNFKGSPILIKHIFFNLLKNALYYIKAAHKGKIYIHTSSINNYNVLYFKDTGKGMDSYTLQHIFDSFYTRTSHGTGIGLAFCKRVMEELGGSITCRSKENKYAEFILKFPKL